METGVLAGYPMVDVRASLLDGKYHEVDSSELAFKIAASMGFREAVSRADPVLLEPVMEVEVVMPQEFMGEVIGDLNCAARQDSRHGEPRGRPGGRSARAAGHDVRLCDPPAFDDAGPSYLHDAVRRLRTGAAADILRN